MKHESAFEKWRRETDEQNGYFFAKWTAAFFDPGFKSSDEDEPSAIQAG